ncbi:RNA polymerase I-specific transcription-initiation factor-domain-containing protein [Diplogelasinospora grovesii]|uniref:RNA polymerase I-specific transcription-initiation factor-domain-containing protein n=1 Tax=Diplogelasinospora grovesii TaxID=303347 RepID=A0AAN6NGZ2_9PEZI|nr:RNA polymerase I-specific transcription-initiation factor-domain-containing protein [Diplogelasinospora grovesii]
MAEEPDASRPVSRSRNRRRRLDDIAGRFTYIPSQQNGTIGEVHRNRATGQTPNFQQVSPFSEWCPPASTATPQLSDLKPHALVRAQKNWLLKSLPDAFIGDAATESLLLEETTNLRAGTQPANTTTMSLLAVGEISDVRDPAGIIGHAVLATAAGESGHVLRLTSLTQQEWTWTGEDVRVHLNAPDRKVHGEWCQDSVPISLIKFATEARQHEHQPRWLIVQKATSTTVYEPEVRNLPTTSSRHPASTPGKIRANPLFTIRCDQTGGRSHSDVSFTLVSETNTPQLAIINEYGYWSVWDIVGARTAGSRKLTPVLIKCGNILVGSVPALSCKAEASNATPHMIQWLSVGDALSRPGSSAEQTSDSEGRRGSEPALIPSRLLLLCNSQALYLFDVETGTSHPASDSVLPNKGDRVPDRILDMASSPFDPSQAFVLTNKRLYWVVGRKDSKGTTLQVLISGPHRRDKDEDTALKLHVSPVTYINNQEACFVCILSPKDTSVTIFWFINPKPGVPVWCHRHVVRLEAPSNFTGIGILPVPRMVGADAAVGRLSALTRAQTRFFQLLTLGHELGVSCSLCVWSDETNLRISPPDSRTEEPQEHGERRTLLRYLKDALVVPDGLDERVILGKSRQRKDAASTPDEATVVTRRSPADFTLPVQRICRAITLACHPESQPTLSQEDPLFALIREGIERAMRDGSMPMQSLLDMVGHQRNVGELLRIAMEWADHAHEYIQEAEGRLLVTETGPRLSGGSDLAKITERFSSVWHRAPGNSQKSQGVRERVLRRIGAEILLSTIGISVVPPGWQSLITPYSQPSQDDLLLPSSQPFLSSQTAVGSSQTGLGTQSQDSDAEGEDPVSMRLRRYATIDPVPRKRGGGQSVILSHWELGTNPDDYSQYTANPEGNLDEAAIRRKKRREARRKKAEQLKANIWTSDAAPEPSSQVHSQPHSLPIMPTMPTAIMSSQPRRPEHNTQSSSQVFSFSQQQQPMSQIVPGVHGGRQPQGKKNKGKKGQAGGFR